MRQRAMMRVGLAGAGWVSEHHLDAWAALQERAGVVAIADPDRRAAELRARRYGIPAVFASVEAMLQTVPLDVIDVAAPREFHAPICLAAAACYVGAILCQKPLAPTLAEAESLVARLGSRARLMVHENWRFRPHYRQIHAWISDGHVGEIRTVAMQVLSSGLLTDENGRLPALARQPMLAGLERMLLMEVLIHHVDTLRYLLGPLSLTGAQLDKRCSEIRGEDRVSLTMVGPSGATVTLVGDFMAHGQPPLPLDHLEILGSKGAIVLHHDQLRLTGMRNETVTLDLAANYKASYAAAISHFLDRLADDRPFETSPEDNLRTLEIVEAAYHIGG